MLFTETKLSGAFIVDLQRLEDERGFFARAWDPIEFESHGLNPLLVQTNISFNRLRGTLRGMHYQIAPHEEAKLVRCTMGSIWDVIVDLRHGSGSYRQWVAVELSAQNRRMLYVPEGFAHGFQTLVDDTEVFYQMSALYAPDAARGICWDDPALGIDWPPAERRIMSTKDVQYPKLKSDVLDS
jgi:dTDP-4-dehydrorhamnose 3,5-epimerase